jgi:alpha-tubulin suppressor-like RCC1 family protein
MLEGRPKESTRFPAPELITSPPLTAQVAVHRFALCFVQDDGVATCHARTLGAPVVLPHVRRLVVGNHHACAVTTSDELWCFGANESGQALGNPLPSNVSSPTKIMGSVLDVAVGLRHTCALERDGKIVCFGDNSRGQLGLNGERDAAGRWRVPNLGHPATQIVAGYEQTCALANSGQVSCWGARTPRSNEVRAIRGLSSKARQLAASGHHTCALLESGTVACWQRSGDTAEVVRGSEGSVDLAVGDAHACVRTGSGSVRCWGSNELGQLGRDLPAVRTALSVPRNVLQVSYPVDSHSATAAEVAW